MSKAFTQLLFGILALMGSSAFAESESESGPKPVFEETKNLYGPTFWKHGTFSLEICQFQLDPITVNEETDKKVRGWGGSTAGTVEGLTPEQTKALQKELKELHSKEKEV